MPIEINECKEKRPEIIAVQIPKNCTISDADSIERYFGSSVRRKHWDTAGNRVYTFSAQGIEAREKQYIVWIRNLETDVSKFQVLNNYDFDRRFKKGKPVGSDLERL